MEFVKLDKQGQVSLPASTLHRLGLADEAVLTEDGGVLLRQSEHYDVEIYTDERLAEFEEENRQAEAALADRVLRRAWTRSR